MSIPTTENIGNLIFDRLIDFNIWFHHFPLGIMISVRPMYYKATKWSALRIDRTKNWVSWHMMYDKGPFLHKEARSKALN